MIRWASSGPMDGGEEWTYVVSSVSLDEDAIDDGGEGDSASLGVEAREGFLDGPCCCW